jgi:predicted Zn-dependent protease
MIKEFDKSGCFYFALPLVCVLLTGCLAPMPAPSRRAPQDSAVSNSTWRPDARETDRLRKIMLPLIQAMNQPCRAGEVQVAILNESEINAANAGSCQFYVTTGLLRSASDNQLRGVLAHEIAHQDLGHAAKAQVLNTGLNVGAALLQQLFPGSGAIAPIAGTLVARSYGRTEEYAADRHAIDILRRAGYSKEIMVDTLSWIRQVSGDSGGGFLSTHPGLDDRIAALKTMR